MASQVFIYIYIQFPHMQITVKKEHSFNRIGYSIYSFYNFCMQIHILIKFNIIYGASMSCYDLFWWCLVCPVSCLAYRLIFLRSPSSLITSSQQLRQLFFVFLRVRSTIASQRTNRTKGAFRCSYSNSPRHFRMRVIRRQLCMEWFRC